MLVTWSCPTLCDSIDFCPPGSSVPGVFQARILEWVDIFFTRGSSWPRDWIQVSHIAGKLFTLWATRESHSEYCFVIHPYGFMDQSFIILYYLVVFHMNMLSFALHSLIDGHLVGFQILVIINKQCKHCDTYLFGNISFLEKKKR